MNLSTLAAHKLIALEPLIKQVAYWKYTGDKIVFTNGCFDVFHPGHLHLLKQASLLGNKLIIGLNNDASIQRLKGLSRPIFNDIQRADLLCNLSIVDAVVLYQEDTPIHIINALLPNFLVKGGDYKAEEIVGYNETIKAGGQVVIIPTLIGYSSTKLINVN